MNLSRAVYSAPAKVILSGEHAVVYNRPAFVTALNIRLTCTAFVQGGEQSDTDRMIYETVTRYLDKHAIPHGDARISFKTKSQIPLGRGLGSSAAFSVAAVAGCMHILTKGRHIEKDHINSIAYQIEKRFHTNPSGVDNSASCLGGLIYYRKEFEFLKNISALNMKLPQSFVDHLFLIDSGKPKESTAEMVAVVGRLYNKDPEHAEAILNHIEKATRRMVVSVVKEDLPFFRKALEENGTLLDALGVVSSSANKLLSSLSSFGVGKITGAGGITKGSGYILFFADDPVAFRAYCTEHTIKSLKFVPSHEGVMSA